MNRSRKAFLTELRAYGIREHIPNVTEAVGQFLHMMVFLRRPKNILEIGCANGYSTIWLADAAEKIGAKVHTIDHSAPTYQQARENLKKAGLSEQVNFYFGDAVELIAGMSAETHFDFVFVDGEKASYLDFWKAIEGRLESGAVAVFDDMMAFPEKTASFYDYIQSVEDVERLMLPIDGDDGILLVLKQ